MDRLSDLDALFLASETPAQHLHVLATLVLDASATTNYELFQSRIRERFHLVEPMRRRLQAVPFGNPCWIDDPDIHLERHLHHLILPDGGGLEALAVKAAEIASYPLPRDRPLWEAWFVEGMDDNQVAVIAKIHHSAVDGVSGIFSLAAFFDLEPFPETPPMPVRRKPPAAPSLAELGRAALDGLRERPAAVGRSLQTLLSTGLRMARDRSVDVPLPFSGPRMSYNGALTARRSVAFTRVRLDDIKEFQRVLGATVNDVIVALCAGVLRQYAIVCRELPSRSLVAAVPVSERLPEHGVAGNQLSFMFYALPVHLSDPVARVEAVQRSAAAAKEQYSRVGVGLFANLATLSPAGVVSPAMRALSILRVANNIPPVANVIVSSIRGPDIPLWAAGARLSTMYPMGPVAEGVGLGITVVSYRDHVAFGFMACPDLVPDLQQLVGSVHTELEQMRSAVLAQA